MRRFWLYIQSLVVMLAVLMLVGCAGTYATNASNKNGSVNTEIPQPNGSASKCKDQTWCHNGWCSTHCEAASDN